MNIRFLGHASFIIEDNYKIAIDPFDLKTGEAVDIIFITHSHYDHCSPDDITKLLDKETTIVAPEDCMEKLEGLGKKIISVEPNNTYEVGIKFKTVPAYNPSKPFHPKSNKWVGYIIYLTESVYHPGDTDLIPEMKEVKTDYFLVPIGGTYTMNSEEGAEAVNTVSPKYAIPMHYGKIVGSPKDAQRFEEIYKNRYGGETKILILTPEQ